MVQHRLLETAIREFGAKGLQGASTRGIAAEAGTAMSSITYHYGGKEGLYLAAADYIAEQMDDVAARLAADEIAALKDPTAARAAIRAMLAAMIDKLSSAQSESWSLFIVREQMRPTEAFDRLFAGPLGQMIGLLVELICAASEMRDRQAAGITAMTMFGQVVVLRAARATCARVLDHDLDDPALIADFKARVSSNADAILDRLASEAKEA